MDRSHINFKTFLYSEIAKLCFASIIRLSSKRLCGSLPIYSCQRLATGGSGEAQRRRSPVGERRPATHRARGTTPACRNAALRRAGTGGLPSGLGEGPAMRPLHPRLTAVPSPGPGEESNSLLVSLLVAKSLLVSL